MAILFGGVLLWAGLAALLHTGITRWQRRRDGQMYMLYDLADVAEQAERWLRSQTDRFE